MQTGPFISVISQAVISLRISIAGIERARKKDILFVGGSDEHGVPITIRAMKEGISPQEVVDKYHAMIREGFEQMHISFDIYSQDAAILFTIKQHRIFSGPCMMNSFLKKRKRNNTMMKRQKHFWPTGISQVPVPFAETQMLLATNARDADLP